GAIGTVRPRPSTFVRSTPSRKKCRVGRRKVARHHGFLSLKRRQWGAPAPLQQKRSNLARRTSSRKPWRELPGKKRPCVKENKTEPPALMRKQVEAEAVADDRVAAGGENPVPVRRPRDSGLPRAFAAIRRCLRSRAADSFRSRSAFALCMLRPAATPAPIS